MTQPEPRLLWDPGEVPTPTPNKYISKHICSAMVSSNGANCDEGDFMDTEDEGTEYSRTELDSHANMPVVGRNAFILAKTGRTVDVNAFSPDYEPMTVPLVDAAIQYDCPYQGSSSILVIRNALYVPRMSNNLIPPFMMREANITVNDVPKIQMKNPTEDDHAIVFPETGFRIPLSLWGVFSYFPSSKPSLDMVESSDDVYMLTPTTWNPNTDVFALNEESMIDWEGHMVQEKDRVRILMSEVEENAEMASVCAISNRESDFVNTTLLAAEEDEPPQPIYHPIPAEADEVGCVLAGVSPIYDPQSLCEKLQSARDVSTFKVNIGATVANEEEYLFDPDSHVIEDGYDTDEVSSSSKEVEVMNTTLDELLENNVSGQLDLDEIMVSAAHARPRKGVDASHLSKVWRIDVDTAQRTLDVTTQGSVRRDNPVLSRNYSTNDRMLRYPRINEYFFMDTFFATKHGGKSSRGHTCCQLFVTDKGFVYVVPMYKKSDVLYAVKEFTKSIGAPEAIICDPAGEQRSNALRKFLQEIGTALRPLEEGTPWMNRAELYIGLIKEAVRKDMKEANCPVVFWDYCVERRARINNLTAKDMFK